MSLPYESATSGERALGDIQKLLRAFACTKSGVAMEIKNAIITSATLRIEDHNVLDGWLDLDYGGAGQGFGGYSLYLPKSYTHHQLLSTCGHFVYRCLEIAGAQKWEDLKGKTIRVEADHCGVRRIGHIVRDDWFCPADDFGALDK